MNRKERTRRSVGSALVSLMGERPYREITVEDVADRADVSRSTFYSHFDGKDDLLTSHYAQFFDFIARECMRPEGDAIRIAPVALMLEHLRDPQYREFYRALSRTDRLPALRASAIERLSATLEIELKRLARDCNERVPINLVAHFVAASFMDLIEWWVGSDAPHSPAEMEEMFQQWMWPAIERALLVRR